MLLLFLARSLSSLVSKMFDASDSSPDNNSTPRNESETSSETWGTWHDLLIIFTSSTPLLLEGLFISLEHKGRTRSIAILRTRLNLPATEDCFNNGFEVQGRRRRYIVDCTPMGSSLSAKLVAAQMIHAVNTRGVPSYVHALLFASWGTGMLLSSHHLTRHYKGFLVKISFVIGYSIWHLV